MNRWGTISLFGLSILLVLGGFMVLLARPHPVPSEVEIDQEERIRFVDLYCASCHNQEDMAGNLALDSLAKDDVSQHPQVWEKVVRRLTARQMPPSGEIRPTGRTYDKFVSMIAGSLDREAEARPEPGRTDSFRRLNRTEYQNAIRDLLALDIDASTLLPPDESGHGFDNVTVGDLSPTLLERYISAAQKISKMAVGSPGRSPGGDTIRIRPDITQEEHIEGLPFGTRGGALIAYTFPQDGEYDIQLRLARDRNEQVEGLREAHEIEVLLDRDRKASFTVNAPKNDREHGTADQHLKARVRVTAGPHALGVTFLKNSASLMET